MWDSKGFRDATSSISDLTKLGERLTNFGKDWSLHVTAPIVAAGGLALKMAGDFESAMNQVQANTNASGKTFDALKEKAMELGDSTVFSSSEAANAMTMLAKNGLNVDQILGGALDASVALAAATGSDLSAAADVATDAMQGFNIQASNMGGVVDEVVNATLASKLSFDDYRLALGQAGGVAGSLGVSFSDFNTALASTAFSFASGSDAGTSFKNFLIRLVPQSKEAAEMIDALGLRFFDAQGNMLPMQTIAGNLQAAFSGLSEAQRTEAAATIFGTDAMRTALALAKTGAGGFAEMAGKIQEQGTAAQQAAMLTKGLKGAYEELGGALENLSIRVGDAGLLPWADQLVRSTAELVRRLSDLSPELLRSATSVASFAAATGPVLMGVGLLTKALPYLKAGFAVLTGPIGIISAFIVKVSGDIMALDKILSSNISWWEKLGRAILVVGSVLPGAFGGTSAATRGLDEKTAEGPGIEWVGEMERVFPEDEIAPQMDALEREMIAMQARMQEAAAGLPPFQ